MRNAHAVAEKQYLHRIDWKKPVMVRATDGTDRLANVGGKFTGYPDAYNYGHDSPGQPTPMTAVCVYEQIRSGRFIEVMESVGYLERLFFYESQIVAFLRDHRELLRTEGHATFIPFKRGEKVNEDRSNVFISEFYVGLDHRLLIGVSLIGLEHIWDAIHRHRFVLPLL